MEKRNKKKAVDIQESIRHILFYDWDPIGINDLAPYDEYDSYIGGIYRLLASGASEIEIIEHLRQLEITYMESTNQERRKDAAKKLINLNISL